jgi:hypothetical protein
MKFKKLSFQSMATSLIFVLFVNSIFAQNNGLILTKKQALEDLSWLKFSLEYVHPRLYKFDNKKNVDARFDSLKSVIGNKVSGLDFLTLVTKANATVKCGHLYTIAQGDLNKEVLEKKVLPFYVKVLDDKLHILNDCSNISIPNGSQILSINGKADKTILSNMLSGIAADGNIQTRKMRLMERYFNYAFQGFDLYYQLYVDRSTTFNIEYLEYETGIKRTAIVEGLSIKDRQERALVKHNFDEEVWFKTPSPKFKIDEQNKYATLTVSRSFYDKKIDPDFDSLLTSAFLSIKQKKIEHLILDLRNNEGGSEYQQIQLMSYLYDKPFKLYQNIYISRMDFRPLKSIIVERDTSKLLFNNDDEYMRKLNENLWINNYEYSDNLQLKEPKPDVFKGKLYVLMNGACFSSAADLISDLKKTTNAVFIGEESGGMFEGPTGGDAIVVQLPNSKIMVRISPNIQIGYLYQKHPIGRGVLPNYTINYTIKDILQHTDLEMEFAKKLIKTGQK